MNFVNNLSKLNSGKDSLNGILKSNGSVLNKESLKDKTMRSLLVREYFKKQSISHLSIGSRQIQDSK